MTDEILAIDHLMMHVPDSLEAGSVFERLGFAVTPKSVMPGLSNRLICFGDTPSAQKVCNYIELMVLEDAAVAPPPVPQLLEAFGPVSMVLSVDNAREVHERLKRQGLRVGSVLDIQRDWKLPGGEVVSPAFSVAIPEIGQAPIYWNYCEHKTAEHYVRPEFVQHPNGAVSIAELFVMVDDPDVAAEHYATYWQVRRNGESVFPPHGPALRILPAGEDGGTSLPDSMIGDRKAGIKAMRILVRNVEEARRVIEAKGTTTIDLPSGFGVSARDAAGCAIMFEGRDATGL